MNMSSKVESSSSSLFNYTYFMRIPAATRLKTRTNGLSIAWNDNKQELHLLAYVSVICFGFPACATGIENIWPSAILAAIESQCQKGGDGLGSFNTVSHNSIKVA